MSRGRRLLLGLTLVAALLLVAAALSLSRMNRYRVSGELEVAGLGADAEVVRDEKGMAAVRAQSLEDATFLQGFLSAQDRLFQMQLAKLFAQGRLTEMVGRKARPLDVRQRVLGFHRLARRHAPLLDPETRRFFDSYTAGVNAYLRDQRGEWPLELRLAGLEPEPWTIVDSLSILYLMSWNSSANLRHELVGLRLVDHLGEPLARTIFPRNVNPDFPPPPGGELTEDPAHDPGAAEAASFIAPRGALPGSVPHMESTATLFGGSPWPADGESWALGSNNWVVGPGRSPGGRPILAGDPHLDPRSLPGVWYPITLIWPDHRAVGGSIPGLPGLLVGRTQDIAFSPTNAYGDTQDLFIEQVDPADAERYLDAGSESRSFERIEEPLRHRDGDTEILEIRATRRGPVVTDHPEVLSGLGAEALGHRILTLRWAPAEAMEPSLGFLGILTARSVEQADEAFARVTTVPLNYVFADVAGGIGWRVTGRVPTRLPGAGELPWPVAEGEAWTGWIEASEMPHAKNPARGWLGTANHLTLPPDYPHYFTNFAASSYRYRRLLDLLAGEGPVTPDDHWAFQLDTLNPMAQSLAPLFAEALRDGEDGAAPLAEMADLLAGWDHHDRPGDAAPLIFQEVLRQAGLGTFRDELGEELTFFMFDDLYWWQERFQVLLEEGTSLFFDDRGTEATEGRDEVLRRAAVAAFDRLEPLVGPDPATWKWGELHHLTFRHPIRRQGLGAATLGSGPHAMGGSAETLLRGWYDFGEPFGVTHCASLRMVADLSDPDRVLAVLPGGVSERLFHPHQKDQIEAFMAGEKSWWWFSDEAIDAHAVHRLALRPPFP